MLDVWREVRHERLIILGSGPAGYSAAVYAARANLKPLLITGMEAGGQLTTTTDVDNWPGDADGVQGPELMERMRKHAERFDTEVLFDHIDEVELRHRPFTLNANVHAETRNQRQLPLHLIQACIPYLAHDLPEPPSTRLICIPK